MNNIKATRKKKALTLRKLASLVGVSRTAILDYENLKYPPNQEVWEKLKSILELPGEFSDYFDRKNLGPGNRKYTEDAQCKVEGCTEKPVAKWLCRKHYIQSRSQANKNLV